MNTSTAQIDFSKVESFAGQVIGDMSATMGSAMTQLGHKLGLFKAMHGAGPLTSEALASKTGTYPRYVQEWLNCQAAAKYVLYDPATRTYELPLEHGIVLADADSPAYLASGFDIASTVWSEEESLIADFKSGKGLGWHKRSHKLFFGVEAFYRTGYQNFLIESWIPALHGIKDKLVSGGKIADIGCGHGASTILMAKAFPKSVVYGFDYHHESIQIARERAAEQKIENVIFQTAFADDYVANAYDLICFMDAFHDLGHPSTAAEYARKLLAPGGSLMLVEPMAGDSVEDNINPIGRMFYAGSTALCLPHSQSDGGECLGAQAGGATLHGVLRKAGFSNVRTATTSHVNLIIEAKA